MRIIILLLCFVLSAQAADKPLRIAVDQQWNTLNPVSPPTLMSWKIQDLIYDRLFYWDSQKQRFVGGLAQSLEYTSNKNYLEFKLKNIRSCSGRKLEAKDILWSFEVLTSEDSPVFRVLLQAIKKFEVLPDERMRIHFESSKFDATKTALSSFRVFAKPVHLPVKNLEGFGPYCLKQQTEMRVQLQKNPNFTDPAYPFAAVEFKYIPDHKVQLIALQNQEIDVTSFSMDQSFNLPGKTQKVFGPKFALRVETNLKDLKLAQKPIREKLETAIDKNWVRNSLWKGTGEIDGITITPGQNGALTVAPEPINIAERAKLELKSIIHFHVHYHDDRVAPFLTSWQKDTKDQGMLLTLDKVGLAQGNKLRQSHNFQLYADLSEQTDEYHESLWATGGEFNTSSYSNKEVDKLFEKLSFTLHSKDRKPIQEKIGQLIEKDQPELRFLKNIPSQAQAVTSLDTSGEAGAGQWFFQNWKWR